MEIYITKGKIYKILPEQVKSDKFRKQEIILQVMNPTDKGTFVDFIRLQCINDKISQIEGMQKGDFCICKFTITGRKLGKDDDEMFYTNLDVIELKVINKTSDIIKADIKPQSNSYAEKFPGIDDTEDDILSDNSIPQKDELSDLPFILTIPITLGIISQFIF